jgi:hypothetical protein
MDEGVTESRDSSGGNEISTGLDRRGEADDCTGHSGHLPSMGCGAARMVHRASLFEDSDPERRLVASNFSRDAAPHHLLPSRAFLSAFSGSGDSDREETDG